MRVAILGSGRGSNAAAILRAQAEGRLGEARVIGLWSDIPGAGILALGPLHGVPAVHLDPGPYRTKFSPEREAAWAAALRSAGADLVVLAGLMRVIKAPLLEAFPGLDGIGQTWRAGVPEGGCTVHWVTAEVDAGAHLGQARVPRLEGDTLESFASRVHEAEHRLLPEVIARLSQSPLP